MTCITVYEKAFEALMAASFRQKQEATELLSQEWQQGNLSVDVADLLAVARIPEPGRPRQPELVHPRNLKKRKLFSPEGHAAFIHALAHIEFNAINLALDAVYRFRGLPSDYYAAWIQVALEEAYHHQLLADHLQSLGYSYGDFPAHNGLWDIAMRTDGNLLLRMALVPRVFEARGLDVTPPMIKRLQQFGDEQGAEILGLILRDEIGHVEQGNRWYQWACQQEGVEPQETFVNLIRQYLPGRVKGPFHIQARLDAGFTAEELSQLENLEC